MAVSRRRLNNMYDRAIACLDAEFAEMPADSGGKISADEFRAAYAVAREKGTAQAGFGDSAKAGTGERSVARINLRQYRSRLWETAIIIERKKPGFAENFPPPSGESDDELTMNTLAVTPKAIEMRADFAERGLTTEYLESGTALVAAFRATLEATNEALSHRGAAVGGKKSAYRQTDEAFDETDIYIRNQYRDQPDKLNAWHNATRIEKTSKPDDDEPEVPEMPEVPEVPQP